MHDPRAANAAAAPDQARMTKLESIRGLAALLVVLFHLPRWNPLLDVGLLRNGYLMVDLFFVLSGFVICRAYADRLASPRDLLRFQFLRLARLYPVHLVFLVFFLLIEVAKYAASSVAMAAKAPQGPDGMVSGAAAFSVNSGQALLENIFLVQAVLPDRALTFNFPAWSISVEFWTYLVFGLVVLLAGRRKTAVFLLMVLAALGLLATGASAGHEALLRGWAGFFTGCLSAFAVAGKGRRAPAYLPWALGLAMLAFLQFKTGPRWDSAIYFLTAGFIAALVLSPRGLFHRLLEGRVLVWLGTISYSVYMAQAAVLWLVGHALRRVFPGPYLADAQGQAILQLSAGQALAVAALVLALVLLLGQLSYRFIEKPFRERSRRFLAERGQSRGLVPAL